MIPTAKNMFSGKSTGLKWTTHLLILSGKSDMAAAKPEVHIYQMEANWKLNAPSPAQYTKRNVSSCISIGKLSSLRKFGTLLMYCAQANINFGSKAVLLYCTLLYTSERRSVFRLISLDPGTYMQLLKIHSYVAYHLKSVFNCFQPPSWIYVSCKIIQFYH